jgi:FAD/FMN-containing dehydrogenase
VPEAIPIPDLASLQGRLLRRGDPGYEQARTVFNGAIDRRPLIVARCTNAQEVVAAIQLAGEQGLDLTVRSGGHGVSGAAVANGALMIDLTPMKKIVVDPVARTARVGSGVTWGELDATTQEHGLAITGGRVSNTGVAGLTLGSGSGWLERAFGLTCDSLISATMVTADGRIVRAADDENAELFWGLRGGGGNFGVVTEFAFRLQPVGPLLAGGLLLFSIEDAPAVIRGYREFIEAAPDEIGGGLALMTAPPAPFVPPELVGRPVLAIIALHTGDVQEGQAALAPLRELGPVAADAMAVLPYAALQTMIDEGNPWGVRAYFKASFMPGLADEAIDAFVELAKRRPSPLTTLMLQPLGGAFARVGDEETALGHRSAARWCWHALTMWQTAEEDGPNRAFSREVEAALRPHSLEAVHPNYVSDTGTSRVRSFYSDGAYARLLSLKREWDPANVFHHNQNIDPGTGA